MGTTKLPLLALVLACSTTLGCASLNPFKASNGALGGPAAATPSFTDKLTAWFKGDKPKSPVAPAVDASDSALSLNNKPKLNPDVNVAMAQMAESHGKIDEAEKQYRKALDLNPQFTPALLGLARLKDRAGQLEAATKYYQKAIMANPQDATAFNDLGLCFHRRAMLKESAETLHRAVALQPNRKLYRNNLAAVLVDMNRPQAALEQLVAADGQAVGHYNLGYLLMKNGDRPAALTEFRAAAAADPGLDAAQQWIARLSGPSGRMDMQVARKTPPPVYRNSATPNGPATGPVGGSTETQAPPPQTAQLPQLSNQGPPASASPQTSQLLQLSRPAPPADPPAVADADSPIAVMAAPEPLDSTSVSPSEEPAPVLTSQAAATPAVTSRTSQYLQASTDETPADAAANSAAAPPAMPPATVLNASDSATGTSPAAPATPVQSSPATPDSSGPQLGPSARRTATALPRY